MPLHRVGLASRAQRSHKEERRQFGTQCFATSAVPETPLPTAQIPAPVTLADPPPAAATFSPAACAALMAEMFPAVFAPGAHRPLKLRIQADVQLRAPGIFTRKSLSIFLQRHTTTTAYLKALLGAPHRVDLDGLPAGEVAEEHREAAAAELARRRQLHDARRAAERDAQRKANDESRRLRDAEDTARTERAALLRAYETTTLTRTNFCALKQVPEAELDARLAQARQERTLRMEVPAPAGPDARPFGRSPHAASNKPPDRRAASGPKRPR